MTVDTNLLDPTSLSSPLVPRLSSLTCASNLPIVSLRGEITKLIYLSPSFLLKCDFCKQHSAEAPQIISEIIKDTIQLKECLAYL
jgi:hypothetical protein